MKRMNLRDVPDEVYGALAEAAEANRQSLSADRALIADGTPTDYPKSELVDSIKNSSIARPAGVRVSRF